MLSIPTTLFLLSVVARSLSSDPWRTPCFNETCVATRPSSMMILNGPKGVISDVSEISDWIVFECDPKAIAQEIRIICKGPEANMGCKNLDEAGGPTNKIVRLPPNCGEQHFAIILRSWVHENQSIPADIADSLSPQSGLRVRGLALDTIFSANSAPSVQFAFMTGELEEVDPKQTTNLTRRGMEFLIGPFPWLSMFMDWALDKITKSSEIPSYDIKATYRSLKPYVISIRQNKTDISLISAKLDCNSAHEAIHGSFSATVTVEIDLSLGLRVFYLGGTSYSKDFRLYGKLSGRLSGVLRLSGTTRGAVETEDIILADLIMDVGHFEMVNIGPKFQLVARLKGDLDLAFQQDVGFDLDMNDVAMWFPNSVEEQSSTFKVLHSPLNLKLDRRSRGFLKASVHIMPRLALDITMSNIPKVGASLFAEFDFSGFVGLDFGMPLRSDEGEVDKPNFCIPFASPEPRDYVDGKAPGKGELRRDLTEDATKSGLDGCVHVWFNVAGYMGCSASFFSLFGLNPADFKVQLFESVSYELFKSCQDPRRLAGLHSAYPEPLHISTEFSQKAVLRQVEAAGLAHLKRSVVSRAPSLTCRNNVQPGEFITVLAGLVEPTKMP